MDQSEFQKSQLPNTSIDDSPFLSLKNSRLRKKKIQSKLMYLKQDSTKRKKNNTLKVGDCENNCKSDRNSPENSVLILPGETPNSADVTSENISGNKPENAVRACPVCWKRFEDTGDQMQHMKACAAKHNLTLKQLLDALDLQTKQIEERKTLGLPCVPATSNVRKGTSKKSSSVNDRDDPDLQLGLALSVSMRESEEQNHLVEQEVMLEAGLGDEVATNQASLLERFGFTNTRPVLPSIHSRARPGKTKLKGTPVLLVRTQGDRERLITEKVANILTTEENQHLIPHSDGDCGQSIKNYNLHSETLFQLQNGECCLWKKASAPPSSRDCDIYYVESLSYIISPCTIKAGSKLKHLSQVPCRLKTPEKCLPPAVGNLSLNLMKENGKMFTVSPQDSFSQQKNEDKDSLSINDKIANGEKIITSDSTNTKTQGKLNQFISKFLGDWNNLLNNSHMSDIKILVQDGEEIFAHELVLFVRCSNILQDVKQANDSVKYIMWEKISFKGAIAFLDFIYCGSTCKIDELNNCGDEIVFLSTKYCVEDLCCYLNYVTNEREIHVISECQDSNSTSSDVNSKIVKPYNAEFHDPQTSDFRLVPTCKSQTERSMVTELNAAKSEEKYPENNYERSNRIMVVYSPQESDALHESCLSPDPFVDSCDLEVTNTSYTWKPSSPNTQQNMDNLLEALNVEDEKLHQVQSDNPEQSLTSGILKESPEVEIVDEERDVIHEASSTIKKRKLSDNCNSLGSKQICMKDRNSVRKSLLPSFSDEGENVLCNEKEEGKINYSQNICKSPSVSSVASVGNVSVNSSIHERAEEMNVDSREVLEEVGNTNVPSSTNEELKIECSPNPSSEKLNDVKSQVADTSTDILGDFCADYEYQNFYGNYSPFYSEKIPSHSNYDTERFVRNSGSKKQMFFEASDPEEKNKSPFSSPLSVKSLTRGVSPFKFLKHKSSRKKLTRTRSSSDISVNADAAASSSSSSPISVKCLSQSSIHLKPSHDTNTERSEVQSVSDAENVVKPCVSSGWALQSPVTPSNVQRTPSRSLNSVKRLLEDSFTAELEKHLLERKLDNGGWPCSTPNSTQSRKSGVNKCIQNVKTGDNCVTPIADYSGMDTPMLKRELQKYGLKPLKRKRAKQILRHIYNELHPLVPVQSNDTTELVRSSQDDILPLLCTVKQSDEMPRQIKQYEKKSKIQKDDAVINSTEEPEISSENEVSFPSTQESSSSSQCQFEVLEDPAEDGQIDVSELPVIVRNYIMTNPEFHQQVLLYEPIWLEQLHENLKEKNYKFKLSQLMECLDEECITFRTIQMNKTKKRQKKEQQ